jgi:hypothetical protein
VFTQGAIQIQMDTQADSNMSSHREDTQIQTDTQADSNVNSHREDTQIQTDTQAESNVSSHRELYRYKRIHRQTVR